MAEGVGVYALILALYVPWLLFAVRYRVILRYPVVSFCFLGLFTQNAMGSVFVLFPELASRRDYFSSEYVWMLVLQILLFYLVTTPYLLKRRGRIRPYRARPRLDGLSITALALASLVIVALYVMRFGTPPLVMALSGQLSGLALIRYRVDLTYGLEDYSLYHLGITVFPTIVAVMSLLLGLVTRRKGMVLLAPIAIVVTALPAGKGSIVDIVTALCIAYLLYCHGYTVFPGRSIPFRKIGMWVAIAFVPVVLMYRVYYGDMAPGQISLAVVYRLFGVNSESMAGAVSYARDIGFLDGATLPTVRGLIDHEYINLAKELHSYMFGPGGGVPTSALAEGYLNFGWTGFVLMGVLAFSLVIAADMLFRWLPRNLLTLSMLTLYVLFATKVAQASLSATFVSLTYAVVFAALVAMRFLLALIVDPSWSRRAWPAHPMPVASRNSEATAADRPELP